MPAYVAAIVRSAEHKSLGVDELDYPGVVSKTIASLMRKHVQMRLLVATSPLEPATLTAVTHVWSHSVARILRLVTCTETIQVSCMLFCISFFDFIPVDLHNRRVCQCCRLCIKKQAEDTPSSLSKPDRVPMVRQCPLVCRTF